MKALFSIVFLLFCYQKNFSQQLLHGKIVDDQNQAVSFAGIVVKSSGKGTISDENGLFLVHLEGLKEADTLLISCLGFFERNLALSDFKKAADLIVIPLQKKTFSLPEVLIKPENTKLILEKVIRQLSSFYNPRQHHYEAFFRQLHLENGDPVRLIEALVNVKDPGYYFTQSKELKEKLCVREIRRSEVFEKNGEIHGEHLSDLLLKNAINYPFSTVLNPRTVGYYKLKHDYIGDTLVIQYYYKIDSDPKIESGSLFIDNKENKIQKIVQKSFPNSNYRGDYSAGVSNWKFMEEILTINFKDIGQYTYPEEIKLCYKHRILNKEFNRYDYLIEEQFFLYTGAVEVERFEEIDFSKPVNLYTRKYSYNEDFWKKCILLNRNPLNKEYSDFFNATKPLDEQFREAGY